MEKENKSSFSEREGHVTHPLETTQGGLTASPPPMQLLSSASDTQLGAAPIQRKVTIGESETYDMENMMEFVSKYGMGTGEVAQALVAHQQDLMELLGAGDHKFATVEAMFESFGYVFGGGKEEEKEVEEDKGPKSVSMRVMTISGLIGEWEALKPGITLNLTPSKERSSKVLFETKVGSQDCMLKGETEGKSEFGGLQVQAAHGVAVPNAASVVMEDGKSYLLMGFVKYLAEGLASANTYSPDEMRVAAEGLARVHLADIQMLNVDRFPWRGNKNTGHLFNVFFNGITRTPIGLDSEMVKEPTAEMLEDQRLEMEEIKADPNAYAAKMFNSLSKKVDRNKLNLNEEQGKAFTEGFAKGLASAD